MQAVEDQHKFHSIPQKMKNIPNWLVWRKEPKKNEPGKFSKQPCTHDGTYRTSFYKTMTFDKAVQAFCNSEAVDGIGFALKNSGLMCLDFDADNLNEIPQQLRTLENHTYVEISPSGNGLHAWFEGEYPGEKINGKGKVIRYTNRENFKVEWFYDTGFVTMTGDALNELDIDDSEMLIGRLFDSTNTKEKSPAQISVEGNPQERTDDDLVLGQALQNIHTKNLFYNGDISKFNNDHSAADFALCKDFSKFTKDPEQIERLFKQSALYRPHPEKHESYPSRTVANALLRAAVAIETKQNFSNISIPQESVRESSESSEKPNWWQVNENGTRSFLHDVMAEYLLQKYHVVRYPDAHGDLHIYNTNQGIYENDKSCRQLRSLIRQEETLNNSKIKEVQEYILDTSKIVTETSRDHIALNNGLLDLKNVTFKQFTPNIFLTNKIPTDFNKNADDQFVKDTLRKVTNNHEPSSRNILEMFACVLYPKVLVPKMFYLYGQSAHNGKSSVLYLIHKTFNMNGGNISSVTPQKLAENTFAGSSMYGKLANIVDDQPDQLINDAGTLKSIITGGYVDIEQKGRDSRTVEMNVTMITASNYFPNFRENGKQVNRRLHIIPFEHDFSQDPDCLSEVETFERLSSKSAREYVLLLAIKALQDMLKRTGPNKLTPNDKADQASEDFADYNDPLADFFFEYDKEFFEERKGTTALKAYDDWCKDNHIVHPLGHKRFKDAVCAKYDMEWKVKRIKINGQTKPVKGFKSKN